MKTWIIMKGDLNCVEIYDFLIPLSKGDIVEMNGVEFVVAFCVLNIDEDRFEILIKPH